MATRKRPSGCGNVSSETDPPLLHSVAKSGDRVVQRSQETRGGPWNVTKRHFKRIHLMPVCCMSWTQLRENARETPPAERLLKLEKHRDLVNQRDDLVGRIHHPPEPKHAEAGKRSKSSVSRRFHPWEGGEGLVSGQYVASASPRRARNCWRPRNPREALAHFEAARIYPKNLGEGETSPLRLKTHLDYFTGVALHDLGQAAEAERRWGKEPPKLHAGSHDMTYYRALAAPEALAEKLEAVSLLADLLDFASRQMDAEVKNRLYFATSLPNFLLFDDDLQKRNRTECLYLRGPGEAGTPAKPNESAAEIQGNRWRWM